MIFNKKYNFIDYSDCLKIFLLLACISLFLNGSISPHSTLVTLVLADSENSEDGKDKEVSSDSTEEEKSSEKNSDNEDNGSSEKSDEQDPPKQDDPPK